MIKKMKFLFNSFGIESEGVTKNRILINRNFLLLGLLFLLLTTNNRLYAQQNHSLFLWHDVQQSNLMNPAVPISCKWYVGIPVLSSVHVNYANSSFTFNQLFENSSGTYNPDFESLQKRVHFRNYIGTELHTQLFALGYKFNEYSFILSVTEKNNIPVTYPKDIIKLLLEGNAPFIGDKASLRGTGVYFNHYREYAIGASKNIWDEFYVGIKAKVLFGKLNISTRKTNVNLHTDETTYNLDFEGDLLIHTSLPLDVDISDNTVNRIALSSDINPVALALNRKNPGFAIDAGIIYPYTDQIQLSASVIDLGLIRWRSNLNTFDASGEFTYDGILNQQDEEGGYFDNLRDQFYEQMNLQGYQEKYTTFLPPRFTVGANYLYNQYLSGGVTADVIVHKSKTMPSLTLVGQAKPTHWLGFVGSYTIQNYSFNNLGFGFFIGKAPVQFYIVSDNAFAIMKPLDARMTNVRFGLNINIGCSEKEKKESFSQPSGIPCPAMQSTHKKSYLSKLKPWSKRK